MSSVQCTVRVVTQKYRRYRYFSLYYSLEKVSFPCDESNYCTVATVLIISDHTLRENLHIECILTAGLFFRIFTAELHNFSTKPSC